MIASLSFPAERQCKTRFSVLDRSSERNVKFSIRSSVRVNKSKPTVRLRTVSRSFRSTSVFVLEKLSSETVSAQNDDGETFQLYDDDDDDDDDQS